ncbi:hypothetical protein [Terrarubrum flagellatum]|uniref:hypothetical protein n=1 Tax=Terrirubrum flagellatum TaxID=2895980 RepID=UPI0031453CD4
MDPRENKPVDNRGAEPKPGGRSAANLIAGAFILAMLVFGVWLFNAISESQKAQECLESRRRNCMLIEAPRQPGG